MRRATPEVRASRADNDVGGWFDAVEYARIDPAIIVRADPLRPRTHNYLGGDQCNVIESCSITLYLR